MALLINWSLTFRARGKFFYSSENTFLFELKFVPHYDTCRVEIGKTFKLYFTSFIRFGKTWMSPLVFMYIQNYRKREILILSSMCSSKPVLWWSQYMWQFLKWDLRRQRKNQPLQCRHKYLERRATILLNAVSNSMMYHYVDPKLTFLAGMSHQQQTTCQPWTNNTFVYHLYAIECLGNIIIQQISLHSQQRWAMKHVWHFFTKPLLDRLLLFRTNQSH